MADSLESIPGVGPSTAKKLRDGGYVDIESLAVAPVLELMERTGIGFALAQRIIMWAREKIGWDVVSAKELYEKRSKMLRCTTGCRSLDKLLGGGIETQSLTEFIGPYAVGKTQICFTLCVTSQLPVDKGGLDGMVVYLDTEGTFSPERVHQIAEHWDLDPQRVLENIYVGRVYTSDHQMILVDHLPEYVDMSRVKLLIVDSIISHFRGEYVGRESLASRQQKLNRHLHALARLAEAYNLAVVVTNQALADPSQIYGNPNRPAGGNIMAHACTHRIWIQKGKNNTRIAKLIDSPSLPESVARFVITEKGIEDCED